MVLPVGDFKAAQIETSRSIFREFARGLYKSQITFAKYGKEHLAKGNSEKADSNLRMALMCAETLQSASRHSIEWAMLIGDVILEETAKNAEAGKEL